uniref:Major facilitator superfamily associated domain-containing protein n=1 Tax=Amphimedon queenslandica TaxID=400682 RepID=A0A1X7U4K9_AMPQE
MSDSVPLLSSSSVTSRRRCSSCPSFYRFQFIHSKGALLVLFWDLMISISQNLVILCTDTSFYFLILLGFCLIYFIAGYLGDFLISRYKLVLVGSYITFILLIPLIIIFMLLPSYNYLLSILCALSLVTFAVVRVNLLPFNIDQLIGSSSSELTAVLHWHNIGPIVVIVTVTLWSNITTLHLLLAAIVCVSAVLVSHSLFNGYLDTTPVNTVNPVKLIVRVLCYTRKHKYPENRSALTYWEEEAPSRLDLGKDKYGGPFTEEEVEDVKTLFRLIPLVVVCAVASGLCKEYTEGLASQVYGCNDPENIDFSFSIAYVSIIFFHQFLVYPCFHKYIPSMLKRIGMGLVLIVLLNILYTGLAFIGNYHFGQTFRCFTLYDDKNLSITTHEWIIINITDASLWYMYNVVLVEFILAQCPKSMRGTMIGLLLFFWGLRIFVDFALFLPFLHFLHPKESLGRGFYFLLAKTIMSLIILLIYIFLAKRYKLRVREVEINIHQIAENFAIKNIEQEEKHTKRDSQLDFSIQ